MGQDEVKGLNPASACGEKLAPAGAEKPAGSGFQRHCFTHSNKVTLKFSEEK
jgi:hypothetical protein